MLRVAIENATIAALLLLAIKKDRSGLIVIDSNELHEPQEVMQIQCHDLIIPSMDIPLSIGYVSDHRVPKHSGLASLKVIHKRLMTQSNVRIRDGPWV